MSLEELLVGGDLNIESQLHVHELLVVTHMLGHLLLGTLQLVLQTGDGLPTLLHGRLAAGLSILDGGFKLGAL